MRAVTPPQVGIACPACRLRVPLLVEGSDLCIGCDSLIPDRPFPGGEPPMVQNHGNSSTYVSGTGHRPLPMCADDLPQTPPKQTPTGLDWSKHRAPDAPPEHAKVTDQPGEVQPCKTCDLATPVEELRDRTCPYCREIAESRFSTPPSHLDEVDDPIPLEVVAVTTPTARPTPAYVQQITDLMVTTEGHPDEHVRANRKIVANALLNLRRAAMTAGVTIPEAAPAAVVVEQPAPAGFEVVPRTHEKGKWLTDAEVDEVVRRYVDDGLSIKNIAAEVGCSPATVHRHLRAREVTLRPSGRRSTRGSS